MSSVHKLQVFNKTILFKSSLILMLSVPMLPNFTGLVAHFVLFDEFLLLCSIHAFAIMITFFGQLYDS